MKLFLASTCVTSELVQPFTELVGKDLGDISFALIENAADPYGSDVSFVLETRAAFEALGMKLELVDLKQYQNRIKELEAKLSSFDVIWFGGGNTYYLRWLMKVTGLDKIAQTLLEKGVVYGGGSAGAIVAGPTLKYFDLVDDPKESPEVIYSGLGLTDLIIIPHWGTSEIQTELNEIQASYKKDKLEAITITDKQAVVVSGDEWKILPVN